MMQTLQRLLARIAAVTAIALGAVLGLMLAGFTLVAGLVVGLVALIAAWFGARSLRGPGAGGGRPRISAIKPADFCLSRHQTIV